MPRVTALELENFQSIGTRTVIPIRDLTLLFGPNGAGKSAIFDALDLLKLITSDSWGDDARALKSLLERYSRNFGTPQATNSVGVGIQLLIDDSWSFHDLDDAWSSLREFTRVRYRSISKGEENSALFAGRTLSLNVRFGVVPSSYPSWFIDELTLGLDAEHILYLKGDSRRALVRLWEKPWLDLHTLHSLARAAGVASEGRGMLSHHVDTQIDSSSSARSWITHLWAADQDFEREFVSSVQEVIDFFKLIISDALSEMPVVQASRAVPSVAESIALVRGRMVARYDGKLLPPLSIEKSPLLRTLSLSVNQSDPNFLRLFEAVAESSYTESDEETSEWWDLTVLQRINSFLREELFVEKAYQLKAEILCLAPPDQDGELNESYINPLPKLIRLYLVDHQQRQLEFEDVGSGIGYVLPVLASLAHRDISLIQQPELHLHTALQRRLGDVVIKSVENKEYARAFTLVETHSEQLLLRIMRLIRDAHQREDEVLQLISYEQVAILYFDPQPSGETKVKRLRLAPDGQLIDRWPGGFFNDRLKDIFD